MPSVCEDTEQGTSTVESSFITVTQFKVVHILDPGIFWLYTPDELSTCTKEIQKNAYSHIFQ